LHTEQLAGRKQENQHNEEEDSEAGNDARGDPPVHERHVPGADTECEPLVVVEDGLVGLGLGK